MTQSRDGVIGAESRSEKVLDQSPAAAHALPFSAFGKGVAPISKRLGQLEGESYVALSRGKVQHHTLLGLRRPDDGVVVLLLKTHDSTGHIQAPLQHISGAAGGSHGRRENMQSRIAAKILKQDTRAHARRTEGRHCQGGLSGVFAVEGVFNGQVTLAPGPKTDRGPPQKAPFDGELWIKQFHPSVRILWAKRKMTALGGLPEKCLIVDNSGSMEGPNWNMLITHVLAVASAIHYPIRIAFIRCDSEELENGPRQVGDDSELLTVMSMSPSGSGRELLPTLHRVLPHLEASTCSSTSYPLFFMTSGNFVDMNEVVGVQLARRLDFVFFKYSRAGSIDRSIKEAAEKAGTKIVRSETRAEDTGWNSYYVVSDC
jgi:hypothetical protein